MRKLMLVPAAAATMLALSACETLAGAAAGGAAVAYYTDENDVCDAPTDAGLLDDDC